MEFKTSKVSPELLPEGTTQLYQGHIIKADTVDPETLAARVAARLKMDDSLVKSVVLAIRNEICDCIENGERPVLDGIFTTRFVCCGAFDDEDGEWDQSRNSVGIAFITLDTLKNVVADIVPTNVLSKVTVQLLGAQDATTLEQNCLTIGNTLQCQGKGLKITQANTDEGLFLVKGENTYKATITANTQGTIDATFPSTMTAGTDYVLEVRSRAGNGVNRSLVVSEIADFTVKAAA